MNRRILFVDDEPNVLSGIRRLLRPYRQEWTTEFVGSGAEALATLEQGRFDVIVSDMRMPGMTGDQLLEEVRQRFPHMVRIILTGQCDKQAGLRAMRVAHRILNKPCDPESLQTTIASTCSLQALLTNESILAIVTQKNSMPSLPGLYLEIQQELDAEEPSMERVAAIIRRDIGMVAKILQVANSSFYAFRHEITNPVQAVALLGLETLRMLVLAVGVFSSFETLTQGPLSIDALWTHSQQTSALALAIAKAETADTRTIENAAIGGLLHDAGKLVFLDCLPGWYAKILEHAQATNQAVWQVEHASSGTTHAEVGGFLLQLWGLPTGIVEAVAWHHRPNDCPTKGFSALTAVHAANALILGGEPTLDTIYLERLNLTHRLAVWEGLARTTSAEQARR